MYTSGVGGKEDYSGTRHYIVLAASGGEHYINSAFIRL